MHFEFLSNPNEEVNSLTSREMLPPPVTLDELEVDCEGNEILEEALSMMVEQCYRYTLTVIEFKKIALESKGTLSEARTAIDEVRTNTHDATIGAINAFSRALAREGRDNSWMEAVMGDRSKYGRFALRLILDKVKRTPQTLQA